MKLPLQWINDYAPINVTPEEFQDRLIMCGTAVEGVEPVAGEVSGVVVGRVLKVENMENSDHLHICQVDVGGEAPLQIVCGAPNVAEGLLVPVALAGATLPGGIKIKNGKLRGVESNGMLCASTELGVPVELYPSVGDAGLLIFNEEYPLGADVKPILGIDDTVADFEILANRPDCLCCWGIAREAAVALGTEFKKPEITVKEADGDVNDFVKVTVEDEDLCPRYVARVIKNVRVKESPMWLKKYLHGAGMRSINNVVDITNFIMLETGHPMHAFDLDMVKGSQIIVRKAKEGEILQTLDGKEHNLTGLELLICDAEGPTGVAGVMGGLESEITENTKAVVFECASFDRTQTRLGARALGIRTEASGRFEKGVSPRTCLEAIQRACQMINELDAGDVVPGIIDLYPNPQPTQVVKASCKRIAHRTGVDIPEDVMVETLQKLHFGVEKDGDALTITVPDFRQDIEGEADFSEEVLRIYGYSHIPATNLRGETTPGGRSQNMRLKDALAETLTGMGFYEIMNYSFISPRIIEKLGLDADDKRLKPLAILNPLGEDTSVMRPTLVPSMLGTLALNMNHNNARAKMYEVAVTFDPSQPTSEGLPTENQTLCMGLYGKDVDFYTARDAAWKLLDEMNIDVKPVKAVQNYYHPGRCATLNCGEQVVAWVGEVHPDVRERFDMPERAYLCEIDLEVVKALKKPMGEVKAMPRYPAVSRDLALVMDESQEVGPMMDAMRRAGGQLLEGLRMFDVYRSANLGEGKKSVAFNYTFRAADHTLTEQEITKAMDKIQRVCEYQYQATVRK